jgi:hypothetical protein
MVTENVLDTVCCPGLSLTEIPKVNVPEPEGVPLIVPSLERVSPGGKLPEDTNHEYGNTPPVAVSAVAAYEMLTAPFGSVLFVIARPALIVIVKACETDCAGELVSVTRIMKLYVVAVTGVPPSTPAADKVRPVGNEPDGTSQE